MKAELIARACLAKLAYHAAMINFASENRIAEVGGLLGDVSRATILGMLLGGRALTAGELASAANITPQTTSGHLAKLTDSGMVNVLKQGRHRYYRIASPDVADMLESLSVMISAAPGVHRRPGPKDAAMRKLRTCYDHMAGQLAVQLAQKLEGKGLVYLQDGASTLSAEGKRFFCEFGVDMEMQKHRRESCRACLDWSERQFHIGGKLGSALLQRFLELQWVKRSTDTRALMVTRAGEKGLLEDFDCEV